METEIDCAVVGSTCSTSAGGGTECSNITTTPCTGGGYCDGDEGVSCEGGVEVRGSCPGIVEGGACFLDGDDPYCGYGDECDTNLTQPGETCDGANLRFCLLGKSVAIDCTSLNFTGCVSDTISTRCM